MPAEVKNSAFLISPREILKSAGALQDVSRYVQTLPGVAIGTNDFRNDIIVRGGSPLENLFVVDNIEIPNINTFANFASAGGTVSILDAELIAGRDVPDRRLPGAVHQPHVERAADRAARRRPRAASAAGRRWASPGAGTILEGPIASGQGLVGGLGPPSFLDLFTNDIGIGGVPVLYTVNAKARVRPHGPRSRLGGEHLGRSTTSASG